MHKDPKSEANLVCQPVCHFEDETTRDRSLRYNKLAGRLGASYCESLFSSTVVSSAIAVIASGIFLESFPLFWENF